MRTWARRAVIVIVAALVLGACANSAADRSGPRGALAVVATFFPLAEAASRVGGDRVQVTNLTPVGVEPHDLELTTRQVDQLESADVVLYVGGGFQPAVAEIATRRKAASVDVAQSLKLEDAALAADPHFWLDPTWMSAAAQVVADALSAASPADGPAFLAKTQRYRADLTVLDDEFDRGLESCERRQIVTAHAAFSYLAKRYRLTQLAIAGVSPEAEPDAARLATLAAEIAAKRITTVFFEELVSPDVADTLAREAKVATAVLIPHEGLGRDEVSAGKDYLAVMRDNLAALRLALGCR